MSMKAMPLHLRGVASQSHSVNRHCRDLFHGHLQFQATPRQFAIRQSRVTEDWQDLHSRPSSGIQAHYCHSAGWHHEAINRPTAN